MELLDVVLAVTVFLLAPLAVGLSMGLDRRITARMQNRRGPPLLQPFYDLIKLFGKQPKLLSDLQGLFAAFCLLFHAAAFALFVAGGDLVVIFFVSSMGSVFLIMGAFSARSPYSYLGANRETLTLLAYEPVLFMVIIAIGLGGSFLVSEVPSDLIATVPLALIAMLPVLVILLDKSPYDVATAHQELAGGPFVEFSGPFLGLLKVSKWFQLSLMYGIVTLFVWTGNAWLDVPLKLLAAFIFLFVAILIDNTTARLTRRRMVVFTLTAGIGLIALNLLVLLWTGGVAL